MAWTDNFRVTVGAATKKTDLDTVAANVEWVRVGNAVDHDVTTTTKTGHHKFKNTSPLHMLANGATTWSMGFWKSAGATFYLLIATGNYSSFTRLQAKYYIRLLNGTDGSPTH